jgi:hypothetical protein
MVSHDVDNDFDLNVQVIVRDDVAHALHSGAVDLPHGSEHVGRDSFRLLPDLFEAFGPLT